MIPGAGSSESPFLRGYSCSAEMNSARGTFAIFTNSGAADTREIERFIDLEIGMSCCNVIRAHR